MLAFKFVFIGFILLLDILMFITVLACEERNE